MLQCNQNLIDGFPVFNASVNALILSLDPATLNRTFDCSYFSPVFNEALYPATEGSARNAFTAGGGALLYSIAFCFFSLLMALIIMQIVFGDVGYESGCCCKCFKCDKVHPEGDPEEATAAEDLPDCSTASSRMGVQQKYSTS
jgi:hypothetical protein